MAAAAVPVLGQLGNLTFMRTAPSSLFHGDAINYRAVVQVSSCRRGSGAFLVKVCHRLDRHFGWSTPATGKTRSITGRQLGIGGADWLPTGGGRVGGAEAASSHQTQQKSSTQIANEHRPFQRLPAVAVA